MATTIPQTFSPTIARVAQSQNQTGTNGLFGTSSAQQTLNQNYDMFLQLLTTQLRNQSPLDPMKTEQFSQQVTAYSGVEQQIRTNSILEQMVSSQSRNGITSAIGFLGNDVTSRGSGATLQNGRATWTLDSPAAMRGRIQIYDQAGQLVRTLDRDFTMGSQRFEWDGRNDAGLQLPPGSYNLAAAGNDANGQQVRIPTTVQGRVTGIDMSGSEPILVVGSARVRMTDVLSVTTPGS